MRGLFVQQQTQYQRIDDADDTKPMECHFPRQERSHNGAKASYGLPHIDAGHVDSDGQRAAFAFVPIG